MRPSVTGFEFRGAADAELSPAIADLLPSLKGIIICPSNPFVSVDPLLAIRSHTDTAGGSGCPGRGVSPIVGGTAIKGPTAKMMAELAVPSSAATVAAHYGDLLGGFVLDEQDRELHGSLPVPTVVAQTVMVSLADRIALAETTLEFLNSLS